MDRQSTTPFSQDKKDFEYLIEGENTLMENLIDRKIEGFLFLRLWNILHLKNPRWEKFLSVDEYCSFAKTRIKIRCENFIDILKYEEVNLNDKFILLSDEIYRRENEKFQCRKTELGRQVKFLMKCYEFTLSPDILRFFSTDYFYDVCLY